MEPKEQLLDRESKDKALQIGRASLELFVRGGGFFQPDLNNLPTNLIRAGACFVTLTNKGHLRGCIGHTDAKRPLAEDIARNAAAAARDFRFNPVQAYELDQIRLEVSVLTPFQNLPFSNYEELIQKLRPDIDGVMLTFGIKRALLLPQVWRRIPDPSQFLAAIAYKGGIPMQCLYEAPSSVIVQIFQVQHFCEAGYQEPGN